MASLITKTVSQADPCESAVLEKPVASVASRTSDCCSGSTKGGGHVPEEAGVEVGGEDAAPGFDGAIGRNMTREWNVSVGSFIRGTCMYMYRTPVQ